MFRLSKLSLFFIVSIILFSLVIPTSLYLFKKFYYVKPQLSTSEVKENIDPKVNKNTQNQVNLDPIIQGFDRIALEASASETPEYRETMNIIRSNAVVTSKVTLNDCSLDIKSIRAKVDSDFTLYNAGPNEISIYIPPKTEQLLAPNTTITIRTLTDQGVRGFYCKMLGQRYKRIGFFSLID